MDLDKRTTIILSVVLAAAIVAVLVWAAFTLTRFY
jgi:membrane protein involved in colicin uptake